MAQIDQLEKGGEIQRKTKTQAKQMNSKHITSNRWIEMDKQQWQALRSRFPPEQTYTQEKSVKKQQVCADLLDKLYPM